MTKDLIHQLKQHKAIANDRSKDMIEMLESKIAKNINEAVHYPEFYSLELEILNNIFDKSNVIDNDSIAYIINFGYEHFGVNASLLLPHIKCGKFNNLDKETKSILDSMKFIPIIQEVKRIVYETIKKQERISNKGDEGGFKVDWEYEYKEIKEKYEVMEKKISITKELMKIESKERTIEGEEKKRLDKIIANKHINGMIEILSKDPSLMHGSLLHRCAVKGWKEGIELVLGISFFIDGYVDKKDNNGNTSLILASDRGHLNVVKYLIEKGANIETKNKYGNTSLMLASDRGHLNVVKYLISKGANIEAKNNNGNTVLILANMNGRIEVIKYLISKGANIEAKNNNGNTVLMLASDRGHLEVVKYLIEKGANIEAKSNNENTALILASDKGHFEVVGYLIEKGANIEAKNKYGRTAFTQ